MEAQRKEAEDAAAAASEQKQAQDAAEQKAVAGNDDDVSAAAAADTSSSSADPAAQEKALLEKVAREMELEEAAEAEREAEARAAAEREKAAKAAAEKEKAEKAAAQREKAAAERAKTAEAKKAEAALKGVASAAAAVARAPKSPPQPKSPRAQPGGGARPQLKKGGGKGDRPDDKAKAEVLDSDLQAKLAARRARAEGGAVEAETPPTTGGAQGFDDVRADPDLKVELLAKKERAERVPAKGEVGTVSDVLGMEDGRTELVSFLAGAGELDANALAMAPGLGGLGESGVLAPEIDVAAMMIGHGTGLIGHGVGWSDDAGAGPYDVSGSAYLPPYDPAGTGSESDPLLEEILKASLGADADVGLPPGATSSELERVLQTALDVSGGAGFDPVNEVPVNWGDVAAETHGVDDLDAELAAAAARARALQMDEGGGLFDMKIGTLQVEDDAQAKPRVGDAGRVPIGYLSEQALAPLTAAGGSGVKKVVNWNESGADAVGAEGGGYPVTGAQRRAVIAERQREMDRQRQLAVELAAVQRAQAQAHFAEYKGPPCGVGMALQASTRMLMGTLRNHKRWVIEVDSLLPDGPAAKCGQILPGDVLLSVREASDKVASSVSNRVEEAKALIMGPPGSAVVLRFTRGDTMREHTHASFEVALVRESIKHPPPLPPVVDGELGEEVDWALLPEQATVEPGDTPLSLEGVALASLSNERMQAILTGEEGKTAEMVVRKKDGSQARVAVQKKPVPRPVQQLKQLIHGADQGEKPVAEQRFLGSRTLAKIASALPAAPTGAALGAAMRPVSGSNVPPSGGVADGASTSSWFSKVGGKVGGLWGRVTANNPEADATGAFPEKQVPITRPAGTSLDESTPGQREEAGDGAEEWVLLTSPSKAGSGEVNVGVDSENAIWLASKGGQKICKLLEDKRLPSEVLGPRLHSELGVKSHEDFTYIESDDVTRLELPPVHARKLLELIKEQKTGAGAALAEECVETSPNKETRESAAPAPAQQAKPNAAQRRAQQAQQFLQNREMQKRAREAELLKLQKSLHRPSASASPSDIPEGNVTLAAAEAEAAASPAPQEQCTAIATYQAAAEHEVSIQAGETIKVVRKHPSGWWEGKFVCSHRIIYFANDISRLTCSQASSNRGQVAEYFSCRELTSARAHLPGVTAAGTAGWFPSTYVADVCPIPAASVAQATASSAIPTVTASAPDPSAERREGDAGREPVDAETNGGDGVSAGAPSGAAAPGAGDEEEIDARPPCAGVGGSDQDEARVVTEADEEM